MGVHWESAVFRAEPSALEALAAQLTSLVGVCQPKPRVQVHFFSAGGVVSCELAGLPRRPLALRPEAAAKAAERLGLEPSVVLSPQMLVAERASEYLRTRAAFVYVNDALSTSGYALFEQGVLATKRFSFLSPQEPSPSPVEARADELVAAALQALSAAVPIYDVEGMFDVFYGADAAVASFTVFENGAVVVPPRRS